MDGDGAAGWRAAGQAAAAAEIPGALLRSRGYLGLLVCAALLGVPISAVAFGFLALRTPVADLHRPAQGLGFDGTPAWWPMPLLAVAGLLVGADHPVPARARAGTSPPRAWPPPGPPAPAELPGIALAAMASLGPRRGPRPRGAAHRARRRAGGRAPSALVRSVDPGASAAPCWRPPGSFAAVSTLLGSPLLGAFLLMEASGLGGAMMGRGAGAGPARRGYRRADLHRPGVVDRAWARTRWPARRAATPARPTSPSSAGRSSSAWRRPSWRGGSAGSPCSCRRRVERRRVPLTVLIGLVVAGLAIALRRAAPGKAASDVLYSGQTRARPAARRTAPATRGRAGAAGGVQGAWPTAASLSGFRGGPIFPSMFVGAAGGLACSRTCPG